MKAAFYTLGCKVNQYETQAMEKILQEHGHHIVSYTENADAYVINTCSVTAAGNQKSRQIIRRIRREHPDAIIAVCGCYAQTAPEDIRRLGVDIISGTADKIGFVRLLEEAIKEDSAGQLEILDTSVFSRRSFEVLPAGRLKNRTRAMLKIEDGCTNFCTYCIIPYARGAVRSVSLETATAQVMELSAAGVHEIVLTGIEISSWGQDLKEGTDKKTLIDLTEAICATVPDIRIRLGSLEPRTITEDFCRRASQLKNLCPHFHLSLQSGCDETLKRMNRKYNTTRFLESVALLNHYFHHPAITTDLIVGFPEETEEEFLKTLEFLKQCKFARAHIFPYSPRPDTPAAKMAQVEKAVKSERVRRAMEITAETRKEYLSECVGETYSVLFEQLYSGKFFGRAPNYMEVLAEGEQLHNIIKNVRILSSDGERLYGQIEE